MIFHYVDKKVYIKNVVCKFSNLPCIILAKEQEVLEVGGQGVEEVVETMEAKEVEVEKTR